MGSGSDGAYRAFSVYTYVTLLLFIFLGSVSIHSSNNITNKSVSVSPIVQQIIPDWRQTPFVSINIVDSKKGCASGSQPLFSRLWQGIYASCDCLNAFDPSSESSANYAFNQYVACNSTQTQAGCKEVDAWPQMYQSILSSDIQSSGLIEVCGVTGGLPFQNVTRPDSSGDCPNNYTPCSTVTSPQNSVCYPESSHDSSCPITDILVVESSAAKTWTDQGYTELAFNSTASIVYSKNTNSLPVTTFSMQVQPCLNPYQQSASPNQVYYAAEMTQGGCVEDQLTGMTFDERYVGSGIYTNVYDMQTNYNVQQILEGSPDFATYVSPADVSSAYKISSFNRPTIGWSLSCEANGNTRAVGMQAIATPTVNSSIDTTFFYRMGLTLVVGFTSWFVISFVIHVVALRKFEPKKTAEMMIYVMYMPSRISFLVWGPWLAGKAGENLSDLADNLTQVDKMAIVNECGDDESQINIQPIEDQINEGTDELNIIYVTFWVCFGLAIAELICWCIYLTFYCMNRESRRHENRMKESNPTGGKTDVKYVAVASNNGGVMIQQPQPPAIGQPVQYAQQPMMHQPMQYAQQPMMQPYQQQPVPVMQPPLNQTISQSQ